MQSLTTEIENGTVAEALAANWSERPQMRWTVRLNLRKIHGTGKDSLLQQLSQLGFYKGRIHVSTLGYLCDL